MEAWKPEDLSVTLLASEDRTEGLTAINDSKETSEVKYRPDRDFEVDYRVQHRAIKQNGR